MYTVFSQICMVNKIRSIFFFFFQKINTTQFFFFNIFLGKNNSLTRVIGGTCQIVTHSQLNACMLYTCQNWTRVLNTRVQLDACI